MTLLKTIYLKQITDHNLASHDVLQEKNVWVVDVNFLVFLGDFSSLCKSIIDLLALNGLVSGSWFSKPDHF